MRYAVVGTLIVAASIVAQTSAQETLSGARPRFEIASVKPQREPFTFANRDAASLRVRPGGVFNPTHATVASLMQFAYGIKDFQMTGGPEWIRLERFAINAKAAGEAPAEQIKLMVRSLLEDRFKLVTHAEQRDMRFQSLVLARADGRLGPYIQRLGDDCTVASAREAAKKFPPLAAVAEGGMLSMNCAPLSALTDAIPVVMGMPGMPVIDKTGLTGKFVSEMRFRSLTPTSATGAAPASDPGLSDFAVALQEQLGLKLEAARGPIDVLVVDSVERPAPD